MPAVSISSKRQKTFIRSFGLLQSIEDIGNVVKKPATAYRFCSDIAGITLAPRPARVVTRDGAGEVAAGMVIMLQGANSKPLSIRLNKNSADSEVAAAA